MIISLQEARGLFPGLTEEDVQARLDAIECVIRAYTHNNFQVRAARFEAASEEGYFLGGSSPFIKDGDTVQISESGVNDGLYTVAFATDGRTQLDREIFNVPHNLVTKVEYPAAVKAVARNLLRWEAENRSKVGIKSETLSRYSVTYYDQDANNQVMGYPVSLLGGLAPWMKARF